MNILVTGGAGYIGSQTCKLLSQRGHHPVVIDDLSTGHDKAVRWGPLIVGSVGNGELIKSIVHDYGIKAVIHLAAYSQVRESMMAAKEYFKNNVAGTIELLNALIDSGVNQLVFSSSCATYGLPENTPITESDPCNPISPYGESKLIIEKILKWYQISYGLNWVALRYFNACGADPSSDIGEKHNPETHIIPQAILSTMGKGPSLEVFGTNYSTRDGTAIRDYVHVLDLATAHVLAVDYLNASGNSCVFNLGTGVGYSIREILVAVENICGGTIIVRESERRQGDPPILVASPQKAFEQLGWVPVNSTLENIIQTAWQWHAQDIS